MVVFGSDVVTPLCHKCLLMHRAIFRRSVHLQSAKRIWSSALLSGRRPQAANNQMLRNRLNFAVLALTRSKQHPMLSAQQIWKALPILHRQLRCASSLLGCHVSGHATTPRFSYLESEMPAKMLKTYFFPQRNVNRKKHTWKLTCITF